MIATALLVFEITGLVRVGMYAAVLVVGLRARDTLVIACATLGIVANAAGSLSQLTLNGLIGTPLVALVCLALYDHARDHPNDTGRPTIRWPRRTHDA